MLFNSVNFLIFFPVVVLAYFIIPKKFRYVWLLVASYYFYMSWFPKWAVLLLFSTAATYMSGLLLEWIKNNPGREDTGLMELLIQNIPAAEVSVEVEQETKLQVIVIEIETGEVVDTAAFDADGIRVEEEDHG